MSLRSLLRRVCGNRVMAGPFRGLAYANHSVGSVFLAKILGTYERELWPAVARLVERAPDVLVNIGAAEGYYAVGLARCLPAVRVIAYETELHGQSLIAEIAALNQVADRVRIQGLCAPADLRDSLERATRPVVVIDAEGAEETLLDPAHTPALIHCAILVEVHDFIAPVGELLAGRFASTHSCIEIKSRPRSFADLPLMLRILAFSPWRQRVLAAMDEQRPGPMRWFWMEPNTA